MYNHVLVIVLVSLIATNRPGCKARAVYPAELPALSCRGMFQYSVSALCQPVARDCACGRSGLCVCVGGGGGGG